jgi:hypothetical protein
LFSKNVKLHLLELTELLLWVTNNESIKSYYKSTTQLHFAAPQWNARKRGRKKEKKKGKEGFFYEPWLDWETCEGGLQAAALVVPQ